MLPSPKASSCYVCSAENPLIPQMLSELAFSKEHHVLVPQKSSPTTTAAKSTMCISSTRTRQFQDVNVTASSNNPSITSSWSGLFCFTFEDPDMFYDAEEIHLDYDHDGRHVLTAEEVSLLKQLRGGEGFYNENYVPTPNNMGSRASSRPITTRDSEQSVRGQQPTSPIVEAGFVPQPRESKPSLDRKATSSTSSLSALSSLEYQSHSATSPSNQIQAQQHHRQQQQRQQYFGGYVPPPAPRQLPVRFLRAGKGDAEEGQRRYEATLQWRQENGIDTILLEPHPNFELVKQHYPHFYHLKGKKGEPVFFEQPPKTNLAALKAGGIDLKSLVRHYTMVTEFQWQFIERDDMARSITVLDLEGMRMRDFVGECVEYVKMCSQFTGQHYPERAGHVIVVNVPLWFSMIWNVVKPMVDEVTLQKISIVRGQQEVFEALAAKIPVENIPPEYGGKSMPLGESPEEHSLRDLMAHNNALANGDYSCGGRQAQCRFCSWGPARSY